jgi:hypothetical protein
MKLLTSKDGFNLEANEMLYSIREFAELLESRKNNKSLLLKELAYIYFYYDLSSDFQFEVNELMRNADVIKHVGLPDSWTKDKLLEEAIIAFNHLSQSASSRLLQSVYIGVDKIKNQLESIDLNERDKAGKPVWNIKQINDTIKGLPSLMESIEKTEKQFIKSQETSTTIRNSKVKTAFDGQDLSKIV